MNAIVPEMTSGVTPVRQRLEDDMAAILGLKDTFFSGPGRSHRGQTAHRIWGPSWLLLLVGLIVASLVLIAVASRVPLSTPSSEGLHVSPRAATRAVGTMSSNASASALGVSPDRPAGQQQAVSGFSASMGADGEMGLTGSVSDDGVGQSEQVTRIAPRTAAPTVRTGSAPDANPPAIAKRTLSTPQLGATSVKLGAPLGDLPVLVDEPVTTVQAAASEDRDTERREAIDAIRSLRLR